MNLHADLSQRVVIPPPDLPWTPSPEAGVERRMLERVGEEIAKATTVVRYQPGAKFQTHPHDLGEEISSPTGTMAERKFLWCRASLRTSMGATQRGPGSEALT